MRTGRLANGMSWRRGVIIAPFAILMVTSTFMLEATEPVAKLNSLIGNLTTATSLYEMCSMQGIDDDLTRTLATVACGAYLSGVNDGLLIAFTMAGAVPYCLPAEGVTNELLRAMYIKDYLKHKTDMKPDDSSRVNVLRAP